MMLMSLFLPCELKPILLFLRMPLVYPPLISSSSSCTMFGPAVAYVAVTHRVVQSKQYNRYKKHATVYAIFRLHKTVAYTHRGWR